MNEEGKYSKKYPTLTKSEIIHLTTYTRKIFFRRCKFVNTGLIHGHMNTFFKNMMVFDKIARVEKTFHVVRYIKDTLSSRRGYATHQICKKLRGMLTLINTCFDCISLVAQKIFW